MNKIVRIELFLIVRCAIMVIVGLVISIIFGEEFYSGLRFSLLFGLTAFLIFNIILLFLPKVWAKLEPKILS